MSSRIWFEPGCSYYNDLARWNFISKIYVKSTGRKKKIDNTYNIFICYANLDVEFSRIDTLIHVWYLDPIISITTYTNQIHNLGNVYTWRWAAVLCGALWHFDWQSANSIFGNLLLYELGISHYECVHSPSRMITYLVIRGRVMQYVVRSA